MLKTDSRTIACRALFGLAATLAVLLLEGCTTSLQPSSTSRDSNNDTFPVTVTDSSGRKVTLQRRPERIVSLTPTNTEILFAVGAGDQVIGVTDFCNYPREAGRRQHIGGFSGESISIEVLLSLKPDLILAASELQARLIDELSPFGIPIVAMQPESFQDVYDTIQQIGRITGHREQAEQLVDSMQKRVDAVRAVVAGIPPDQRVTVFYQVWDDPLQSASRNSYLGEMIELAGGKNVFADLMQPYPVVSHEVVLAADPQVIVAAAMSKDDFIKQRILGRPGWSRLSAVREGRIKLLDGDLVSRPGPRMVDALEQLVRVLYPKYFVDSRSRPPDGT